VERQSGADYARNTLTRYLPNKQQESAYGDGRPTCNRVLTSGFVAMGIPMVIPMGISVGMGWVWGLKCHPHGSRAVGASFQPNVDSFVLFQFQGCATG